MTEKKTLNELISLLPMPAIIMDSLGYIKEANLVFKDKFNFSKVSKKSKVKIQLFLHLDISNIIKRLTANDMSISTYDYKFIDLNENQVSVNLHFKNIFKNKILLIIEEKDNFKTHFTQSSKTFGDIFIKSFSNSLSKNISAPITNLLAAMDLILKNKNDQDLLKKLLNIVSEEGNKIKNYIFNISELQSIISIDNERANIHECLNKAIDQINVNNISKLEIYKSYDPSIPEVIFNNEKLIQCFYNIILNAVEAKKNTRIKITTKINHNIFIRSEDLQKVLKLPIHIKISDDGPSINEDIEKFMFYPFITNKKNAEGLGLTFVNLNVSKYGGYFKYERERNSSTFNLYLPLIINRSY